MGHDPFDALALPSLLDDLCDGRHLDVDEAQAVFALVFAGQLSDVHLTALLVALKAKGITENELAGAALAMRDAATPFVVDDVAGPLIDTCGTGGDGAHTVNISTAASFVVAAAGVSVVKHGNRSVSSKCGSADVLQRLGVAIDVDIGVSSACLQKTGYAFLFAPRFHPGVKQAMGVRRALKTRTILNLLGPLVNPARPQLQLLGTSDATLVGAYARVLHKMGARRAMVVHGSGLDELALHGPTQVALLDDGEVESSVVDVDDLGVHSAPVSALAGGDPDDNAAWMSAILQGQGTKAHLDAVAVNAGASLFVAQKAESIADGVAQAREQMANKAPFDVLQQVVEATRA